MRDIEEMRRERDLRDFCASRKAIANEADKRDCGGEDIPWTEGFVAGIRETVAGMLKIIGGEATPLSSLKEIAGREVLAVVEGRVANVRHNMGTGEGRLLIEPAVGHASLDCNGKPVTVIVVRGEQG